MKVDLQNSEIIIRNCLQREYKNPCFFLNKTIYYHSKNLGGFPHMKKNITKILSIALALVLVLAFTGCAPTGEGGGAGYSSILMLVVMLVVFYFFLIRPENKKKKKAEEMRNSLSTGDKITTIGGIVGKIVSINGDLITFETGEDRVRLQVTKWAISTNSIQKNEDQAN